MSNSKGNSFIFKLIKTECGRAKYIELSKQKGLVQKIRLFWFVCIGAIRDQRIKDFD